MRNTDLMVGMELEVTSGGNALGTWLWENDAIGDSRRHSYHCQCESCGHSFDRPNPWTWQSDCTVDAEFISKPLKFGSPEYNAAILTMGEAMRETRATVKPERRYSDAGNHVHVENAHMDRDGALRLERLIYRYTDSLNIVAQGAHGFVRDYNGGFFSDPFRRDEFSGCGGNYVRVRPGYATSEFRLWNAVRSAWRLRLHAGLSAAMMAAACSGEVVTSDDSRTLAGVLSPYADDDTLVAYAEQLRIGRSL